HFKLTYSKILILTICTAGIGGTFQYGYNLSIINAPASYIQMLMNKTWLRCRGVPLERNVLLLWSFTVSAYPLGGLIGAVTAGQMAIMLGRKMSLLLNNVFVITAAVLSGFTEVSFCLPCPGVSMNIQHMYLAESAPKQLRGAVALTSASFTALGLVLGQPTLYLLKLSSFSFFFSLPPFSFLSFPVPTYSRGCWALARLCNVLCQ
uniref:Solute carrier family 2 member 11 n=1 Tax=Strigops habroptila TaxID=2489341 RepID=A0A672URQ9_STRHB